MSSYAGFAAVYDDFMKSAPYDAWTDFIISVWEERGLKPRLVLDLACGTGSVTVRLAKRGYEMIGIDRSADMLAEAAKKTLAAGLDILYLNQSLSRFELYGTVQAAICICDGINYLIRKRDVAKFFSLAANYIEPGGVLIFDAVTRYKFEKIIAGNTFAETTGRAAYIMRSDYDFARRTNRYRLSLFIKRGRRYARYEELHVQRAHSKKELLRLARDAGFKPLPVRDGECFGPPAPKSERVFYAFVRD